MFKAYFKERQGFETVETAKGFACFCESGEQLYIGHFYIAPDARKSPVHFLDLMRALVERAGTSAHVTAHVGLSDKELLITYLKFGFSLRGLDGGNLALSMPIEELRKWVSQ